MISIPARETTQSVVLSTAHMTHDDAILLARAGKGDHATIASTHYGYVVFLPSDLDGFDASEWWCPGLSEALIQNLLKLSGEGYNLATFDMDGLVYEDLESFDW